MTEAKLAVSYLSNSVTECLASALVKAQESRELRKLRVMAASWKRS